MVKVLLPLIEAVFVNDAACITASGPFANVSPRDRDFFIERRLIEFGTIIGPRTAPKFMKILLATRGLRLVSFFPTNQ